MSNDWYYKVMGEEFGPLSSAALRQHALDRRITPETYVRRGENDRWVTADSVKGLFETPPSRLGESAATASMPSAVEGLVDPARVPPSTPIAKVQHSSPVVPPARRAASVSNAKMSYKVLTQKDKWLSSKFDPETLEKALNSYGSQGWRVRTGDTASFPGFLSSNREELITILEREEGAESMELHEYKVLTQKDKWYSGKFDPERLEGALNAYAQQGWSVVFGTTASFPGFFSSNREELIVVLSRRKS